MPGGVTEAGALGAPTNRTLLLTESAISTLPEGVSTTAFGFAS